MFILWLPIKQQYKNHRAVSDILLRKIPNMLLG
jgi:hypothetical protein